MTPVGGEFPIASKHPEGTRVAVTPPESVSGFTQNVEHKTEFERSTRPDPSGPASSAPSTRTAGVVSLGQRSMQAQEP